MNSPADSTKPPVLLVLRMLPSRNGGLLEEGQPAIVAGLLAVVDHW
jgi:hypothetical protein